MGSLMQTQIVVKQFTDTYFSLVTETDTLGSPYPFITEKSYKPLLAGHPFIILGNTGHYKKLHSMGFKSFHPLINESFDNEPDLNTRIEMITHEVEKLCTSDLEQFIIQTRDICLFNHQHYISNRANMSNLVHTQLSNLFSKVSISAEQYFNTV